MGPLHQSQIKKRTTGLLTVYGGISSSAVSSSQITIAWVKLKKIGQVPWTYIKKLEDGKWIIYNTLKGLGKKKTTLKKSRWNETIKIGPEINETEFLKNTMNQRNKT